MSLIEITSSPVVLRLNRDLVRTIKRGHPWVYGDALRELPSAPPGTQAVLLDNKKGRPIARGFYDHACPVALRICDTDPDTKLDDRWVERRLRAAIEIRKVSIGDPQTTGYRLINGEGDLMPGLIVDVYDDSAVMKLDGDGPAGFWNAEQIAPLLAGELNLKCFYERFKERGAAGRVLFGLEPVGPVWFKECGLSFSADLVRGQKTGFFLDQRENRNIIRGLARDARVLNLFSYSGGFSVAAGVGVASSVTSVDISAGAIEAAGAHWKQNQLSESNHTGIVADVFDFLADAAADRQKWNLVVLDPPSFAPNQESVSKAMNAYQNAIEAAARVTAKQGLLAAASCSSHIDLSMFLECCEEGISQARRLGTVLNVSGLPFDHPTPLALPEFRYLKFVLLRLD